MSIREHSAESYPAENRSHLPSPATVCFFLIVALHCVWVLMLPLFPSQDGPHHLYFVDIFRKLLTHSSPLYDKTYFIGRYLPPYSMYYYGLIALGHFMSLEMADKLMVCIFFVALALGARQLLRIVSGDVRWSQFMILPLLLNWPLMMGFLNYCIGIGLACFALAIWCRNLDRAGWKHRAIFLAMVLIVLLTHPVAWLFLVSFVLFDLGFRRVRAWRETDPSKKNTILLYFKEDAIAALIACCGYLYLRSFQYVTTNFETQTDVSGNTTMKRFHARMVDYVKEHGIAIFASAHSFELILYRILIALCILTLVVLAVRLAFRELRTGAAPVTLTWSAYGIVFLAMLPFIPAYLNGNANFNTRLLLPLYLALLFAASPYLRRTGIGAPVAALGTLLSITALFLAVQYLNPVAHQIDEVENLPVVTSTKPGILIQRDRIGQGTKFLHAPLLFAACRYFRDHGLLLFNTAWLEQSHIPVKVKPSALSGLDGRFHPQPPWPENWYYDPQPKMPWELHQVGYIIGAVVESDPNDDIRIDKHTGQIVPALANWKCSRHGIWEICSEP